METIQANPRDVFGKKVRALRRAGFLPAIVYGQRERPRAVSVARAQFENVWTSVGESGLVTLAIGDEREAVLIHDVSRDVLSEAPLHVDFYRVNLQERVNVRVPLEFTGESPAVRDLEGVLVKNVHEVQLEALPGDLPKSITVDISALRTFDDYILLGGLSVPQGVALAGEPETIVASVMPPRSEAELEALEAKPVESVADIEVVAKRGKEEGATEAETPPAQEQPSQQ